MLKTCNSQCEMARSCQRHEINAPDPRVRNQYPAKFEPYLKEKCCGFLDMRL